MTWLYEHTPDNRARFVLGIDGTNPLVCFGLNPSTAEPNDLDPTVTRVREFAQRSGFDGFIMLNVYPLRDTYPDRLPHAAELALCQENRGHIERVLGGRTLTAYAAWGGIVAKRPYLQPLLCDILDLPSVASLRWMRRGELAGGRHPRHPLYVPYNAPLIPFNAAEYATQLRVIADARGQAASRSDRRDDLAYPPARLRSNASRMTSRPNSNSSAGT